VALCRATDVLLVGEHIFTSGSKKAMCEKTGERQKREITKEGEMREILPANPLRGTVKMRGVFFSSASFTTIDS